MVIKREVYTTLNLQYHTDILNSSWELDIIEAPRNLTCLAGRTLKILTISKGAEVSVTISQLKLHKEFFLHSFIETNMQMVSYVVVCP